MNFKSIISVISFSLLSLGATTVSARKADIVRDIEPYVYPQNAVNHAPAMQFAPDGMTYYALTDGGKKIIQYDTASGNQVAVTLDVEKTRETKIPSIQGFTISEDGSRLMVYRNREMIYRRSFTAEYYLFEIKRNILLPLSPEHPRQQAPVISPDGKMVAFVADNNIYLRKLVFNTEVAVTTDGKKNEIINGVPDWTYEEEFSTNCSMAWSPDCSTLCFIKYNESKVPLYNMEEYFSYCRPVQEHELYPGMMQYKYPVAGDVNSTVSVHSYDIDTRKLKKVTFEDKNIEYIPRIAYRPASDQLIVTTLNREQTRMEVFSVNPKSTVVKSILVEQDKAWLPCPAYEDMVIEKDNFVVYSSRSGYAHLYSYSYAGALIGQLTSGEYNITEYYGKDAAGNIYYQSTSAGPLNRVVSMKEAKTGKIVDLTPTDATYSASFAPGMKFYTLKSSSVQQAPVVTLMLNEKKQKELRVLAENRSVMDKYRSVPKREFTTFESDGVTLNAYIIKPADFNPSKKYPVIMTQYSGPGSQQVLNAWSMDWQNFAAMNGYVVVCADARGTGGRDRAFETIVYKNLGHYETIDHVNVARQVARLPYVDGSRIGITGWSYGGYETLMAASYPDNNPFAAAVSIAPVTDWRFYDTVYAERYMLTPEMNSDGYKESAPINHTASLHCPLLMMFGTMDDNVHPANTLNYVSKLQMEGQFCDMFVFPAMNHSINGCGARAVVYGKMMDYFNKNLK
ncbi:MAG: alpha/beta fold hydrolase [Bacteroidales bacterium]|nr:alpha/beta fold hydrolase [Bacteroidales bacterium]